LPLYPPGYRRISPGARRSHHLLYDLARFGLENEIFQATSEAYGLIEGTVERS
jgi:hypothetical protein